MVRCELFCAFSSTQEWKGIEEQFLDEFPYDDVSPFIRGLSFKIWNWFLEFRPWILFLRYFLDLFQNRIPKVKFHFWNNEPIQKSHRVVGLFSRYLFVYQKLISQGEKCCSFCYLMVYLFLICVRLPAVRTCISFSNQFLF